MDKADFLEAKRYQLELILIGAMIAITDDRKKIIELMDDREFTDTRNRDCFKAVRDNNAPLVRTFFEGIGVLADNKERVIDALVRTLKSKSEETRTREAISCILTSTKFDSIDDLRMRLEEAMRSLPVTTGGAADGEV